MAINRYDPTPLYAQMAIDMKNRILSGQYEQGNKIPSERDLMKQYHLSRNTVRKAIQMLNDKGLTVSNHGSGTFVTNLSGMISSRIDYFTEHSQFLQLAGYSAKYKVLSEKVVEADARIRNKLQLTSHESLYRLEKLFYADEKPAIYTIDYVPCNISLTDADFSEEEICTNFMDFIEKNTESTVEYGQSDIIPLIVDENIGEKLSIPVGQPILLMEELFMNPLRVKPLALGCNYYSNIINFNILRRRSNILLEG